MIDLKSLKVPEAFIKNIIAPACRNDQAIVAAFKSVPREFFVDEAMQLKAYTDNALPIGFGQTISQPSLVAKMLYELELDKNHKCLEIGAGSGFVAMLLSKIVDEVYAVELLPELYARARSKIRAFNSFNAKIILSDGSAGYKDKAPYDRIIVSAGAKSLPPALVEQLKEGGIMIIPINSVLIKFKKVDGKMEGSELANVSFVDFVNT